MQLLALTRGRGLQHDEVLEALWPHLDPEAGRSNLHKAASYARRALGCRDSVVLLGGRVSLAPDAEVVIDVDSYERLARDALVSGEPGRCAEVSVLFDDLLPAARYEDWAIVPRERLRELQLQLLRKADLWEQVLALDPLDEVAHRGLMRRYADAGLYGTQARFVRDESYPWAATPEEKREEIEWAKTSWGAVGSGAFYAPSGDPRFAAQYEAYMRAGASPSAAAALLAANAQLDVRPLLPRIAVPTLVLSRRGDPIGPPAPARAMSDRIPGARFVELGGVDHIIWAADTEPLCAEIEAFVSAGH